MGIAVLVLSLAVAAQAAPSLEQTKASSELELPQMQELLFARPPRNTRPAEPRKTSGGTQFILDPHTRPLLHLNQLGKQLTLVDLAAQLDRHRAVIHLRLGTRDWDVGLASEPTFRNYSLSLSRGSELRLAALGDLSRARGAGIDVEVRPGTVYNFHLKINIFNPVRGSTLEVRPSRGSSGPSYAFKTGSLLDAVKSRSAVFFDDHLEYWALYGTDVDAATGRLGTTRSFLFLRLNGLWSKAWPVAESALPLGQPMRVDLFSPLALTRTANALVIAQAR